MLAITVKPTLGWAMRHAGACVIPRAAFFQPADELFGQVVAICTGADLGTGVVLHRQWRRIAFGMARAGYCAAPLWIKGEWPCLVWHELPAAQFTTECFEAEHGPKGTGRVATVHDLSIAAVIGTGILTNYADLPAQASWAWYEAGRRLLGVTEMKFLRTPYQLGMSGKGGGLWALPEYVREEVQAQLVAEGKPCGSI